MCKCFVCLHEYKCIATYYADDLLNLSRSVRGLQSNFSILRDEHRKISLAFNSSKSAVLFFNDSPSQPEHLLLGSESITVSSHVVYPGLTIGCNRMKLVYCSSNTSKKKTPHRVWVYRRQQTPKVSREYV